MALVSSMSLGFIRSTEGLAEMLGSVQHPGTDNPYVLPTKDQKPALMKSSRLTSDILGVQGRWILFSPEITGLALLNLGSSRDAGADSLTYHGSAVRKAPWPLYHTPVKLPD